MVTSTACELEVSVTRASLGCSTVDMILVELARPEHPNVAAGIRYLTHNGGLDSVLLQPVTAESETVTVYSNHGTVG